MMAPGWGSWRTGERGVEPEIIPPDRPDPRRAPGSMPLWGAFDGVGGRAAFAKPSLLSLVIAALTLGLTLAAALTLFLGAFLILLPVAAAVIGALVLTGAARVAFRRL